jgi:muramidase (phage lysozyme)
MATFEPVDFDPFAQRSAIPPQGRALLDTIAGSESPDYNTLYGGGKFEGFTDHPRQLVPIASGPNAGKKSSAAGRYQFLQRTWDEVKQEAGLPDFSPESQDAGAWHLANKTYKQRTGRDLAADLDKAQGNPAAIKSIGGYLSGVWTSLPGGIEPNSTTMSFADRYQRSAPTEMSAQSRRPTFEPIDHDPFAEPPGETSPPAEAAMADTNPAAMADTGGRFSDTAGENFRIAREGVSPAVATKGEAFGGGVIKGASFNFADELAGTLMAGGYDPKDPVSLNNATALVRGLWRRATGDSEADTAYRVTTSAVRDALERQREQQPVASIGGELTGALLTAPATGGSGVVRGAPVLARALSGARTGAAYGALSGAGEGTDAESRATGAVTGGLVGGAVGAPLGAVLPAGRAAAGMPAGLEANLAAQRIGVDIPRAIATDSSTQRFMGQVANKMPGGGPMQNRVAEAVTQTGEAVGEASAKAGGSADAMAAGQGFQQGIQNYFKPTTKSRVSAAYDAVDSHLPANFTRPLSETQAAIADIVARRQASGTDDIGKAVDTVLGGATRPGGLTYAGVKDLRTRVGEMLDTGVFPEGMSQGELRRIYGALSDDLKATVQAAGGKPAMDAFNRANTMHKFVEEWKDNLGKIVGDKVQSGESITNSILRMAQDKGGDLKALTMARAAVPKTAWQDIATTAVSRLGLDRKGEFSPAIFLNDFSKLSDRGKRLLFDSVGSGDVLPHLNDIATVSKKFIEAGKLANTSGTAGHNAAWTALTGIGIGAFVEPITALTIAGGVAGNNVMARALSKPSSAASIARWTRSYNSLVSAGPTAPAIAAFRRSSINLANTLNSQAGAKIQPADIMRAIQAPATGRADNDQQSVPRPPGQ